MIGSGIFLTPKQILRQSNSVGASLCIWGACGILATLSKFYLLYKIFFFNLLNCKNCCFSCFTKILYLVIWNFVCINFFLQDVYQKILIFYRCDQFHRAWTDDKKVWRKISIHICCVWKGCNYLKKKLKFCIIVFI